MLNQLDTLIGFAVVMSVVSLLITILTQVVSALLGLRGKNLADALEAMAFKIDPKLNEHTKDLAKQLADNVLTHPTISDSALSMSKDWFMAWKRASAIRPDELLGILEHIAGQSQFPETGPTTVEQAASKLLQELKKPSSATASAIAALTEQLPTVAARRGLDIINEFNTVTNVSLGNLERLFNSTQDRAKQWFAMHTRVITVIAAFVAAFALQLNSFELIGRISSNAELRSRLVAAAPALQKQAAEIFEAADAKSTLLDTNILAELEKSHPGIITNLSAPHPETSSPEDIAFWISNRLAATAFSNQVETVMTDYSAITAKLSRAKVDELTQQFGLISEEFNKAGMDLSPVPLGRWKWSLPDLLGILASVALLSLGAPFWFNILKSLTSLRPLLAQQIDKKNSSTGTTG